MPIPLKGVPLLFTLTLVLAVVSYSSLVTAQTAAKFTINTKLEGSDTIFYMRYLTPLNTSFKLDWGILEDQIPLPQDTQAANLFCQSLAPASATGFDYREAYHLGSAQISTYQFVMSDLASDPHHTLNEIVGTGILRKFDTVTSGWLPLSPSETAQKPLTVDQGVWSRDSSGIVKLQTCGTSSAVNCIPSIWDMSDVRPEDTLCSNLAPNVRAEHFFGQFDARQIDPVARTRIRAQAFPLSTEPRFWTGGPSADTIIGGDSENTLSGGGSEDILVGGLGNDEIEGGDGSDTLIGAAGADSVNGNDGNDYIFGFYNSSFLNQCFTDTLVPLGSMIDDIDWAGAEAALDFVIDDFATDSLTGGPLQATNLILDTLSYTMWPFSSATEGYGLILKISTYNYVPARLYNAAGVAKLDSVGAFERVVGTIFHDSIIGDEYPNVFWGGLGRDTLFGLNDDDTLFPGAVAFNWSSVSGCLTQNISDGGHYLDWLDGGNHTAGPGCPRGDFVDFVTDSWVDYPQVYAEVHGNYHIDFSDSIYSLAWTDSDGYQTGNGVMIRVEGVHTGNGDDYIAGNEICNLIDAGCGTGNNTVFGGDGNDTILSCDGNDYLDGGNDDDSIIAGTGDDTIVHCGVGAFFANISGANLVDENNLLIIGGSDSQVQCCQASPGAHENGIFINLSAIPFNNTILSLSSAFTTSLVLGDLDHVMATCLNDTVIGNDDPNSIWGRGDDDYLAGGNGVDTIFGNDGNDIIYGQNGAESLFGGPGDDSIDGGNDADTIQGEDGDDSIIGGLGADLVFGQLGNDEIFGNDNNDILFGNEGSDYISGGNGLDTVQGGNDQDTIFGNGEDDVLYGNQSSDFIYGGPGSDQIFGGSGDDFLSGEDNVDIIFGEDGEDSIFGGLGDDLLAGQSGKDTIFGNPGDDVISGGEGDDYVYGEADDDNIAGGNGNDALYGNDGLDFIFGGNGTDTIYGGTGDDDLFGNDSNDLIFGEDGADSIEGGLDNDTLYGGNGADTLYGNNGTDLVHGGADGDTILGGFQNDSLYGDDGADSVLGEGDADTIWGGNGDDILRGNDGDDSILGENDNDSIYGGLGNDNLYGGAASDTIDGNEGDDHLYGNAGNDFMDGGNDQDTLFGGPGPDSMIGNFGNDLLFGEDANDTMSGNNGTDTLHGNNGNDLVFGGNNDDYIYGDNGTDTLYGNNDGDFIEGNLGNDFLFGGLGGDSLFGNEGNDYIYGEDDNDTIFAGNDSDTVSGGFGNDTMTADPNFNPNVFDTSPDCLDYKYAQTASASLIFINLSDPNAQRAFVSYPDPLIIDRDSMHGFDCILPTNSSMSIIGSTTPGTLCGGNQSDTIIGGPADDVIGCISAGNDYFDGGPGKDTITCDLICASKFSNDTILGGDGNDYFCVTPGSDHYVGHVGDDLVDFSHPVPSCDDSSILGVGPVAVILEGHFNPCNTDPLTPCGILPGHDLRGYFRNPMGFYWYWDGGVAVQSTISGVESVIGTLLADTIWGSSFADNLVGLSGSDSMGGSDGDDTIDGGLGDDTIFGDAGRDSIIGASGADYIEGGEQADTIDGDIGSDTLDGGLDNDLIFGGADNDTLLGDEGDDTLSGGTGSDYFEPGNGDDSVFGNFNQSHVDTVTYFLSESPVTVDLFLKVATGQGVDTLIGIDYLLMSFYDDTVTGSARDLPFTVFGNVGADSLVGGNGNDYIDGGNGNDTLDGADGNDSLYGGNGDDYYFASLGLNKMQDSNGRDTVSYLHFSTPRTVDLVYGNSTELVTSRGIIITNDTWGPSTLEDVVGGFGPDSIYGDFKDNMLWGMDGNDLIYGADGPDSIRGGADLDTIYGGNGNDYIEGGEDNDILNGNDGDDEILGGFGQDYIVAGPGADAIDGEGGLRDTLDYSENAGLAVIVDLSLNYGVDGFGNREAITGVEYVIGTNVTSGDLMTGDDADETLVGLTGFDNITGGAGDDSLYTDPNDSFQDSLWGGSGDDTLSSGAGADFLDGGIDNDLIFSNNGTDTIYGDAGDDLIYAGAQADFVDGGNDADTIYGGSGEDLLHGNLGDDFIWGEDGLDTLYGDEGQDNLSGGPGNDFLFGNSGDDVLLGNEDADWLEPGNGNDYVDGGSSDFDTLSFATSQNAIGANLTSGQAFGQGIDAIGLVEFILGSEFSDLILGNSTTTVTNTIYGENGSDSISAGNWGDLVRGGNGNDQITSGPRNDTIYGETGDDLVYIINSQSSASVDLADGGNQQDTLSFSKYTASAINVSADSGTAYQSTDSLPVVNFLGFTGFVGTSADDSLQALTNIPTSLWGGNGRDTLVGGNVDDDLYGGAGNDYLVASNGSDVTNGGSGIDTIDYSLSPVVSLDLSIQQSNASSYSDTILDIEFVIGSAFADSLHGDVFDETIYGGDGFDTIDGDSGADLLVGGNGNDSILGGDGADIIYGGDNNDTVDGQLGPDSIYGGLGSDVLAGDNGNDLLHGNEGDDILTGGDNDDSVYGDAGSDNIDGGLGDDDLFGGDGNDVLRGDDGNDLIHGNADSDTLYGGEGDDTLNGNDGADWIDPGLGSDNIDGGSDIDTLYYYTHFLPTHVDLALNRGFGGSDFDTISGIEYVIGTVLDDILKGDNFNNTLVGTEGADTLVGRDGNDSLDGGLDNDVLDGGAGSDTLLGGPGDDLFIKYDGIPGSWDLNDYIYGNDGIDTIDYSTQANCHEINLSSNPGTTTPCTSKRGSPSPSFYDELYDIEVVIGGPLEDYITGSAGNNTLIGNGGYDEIFGQGGDDLISGGDGNDDLEGNDGDDTLLGGNGDDYLLGGSGDDSIDGEDGNDYILWDLGRDTIIGGNGRDTISYYSLNGSAFVDLLFENGTDPSGSIDSLVLLDDVVGSEVADTLYGNDGPNEIWGNAGGDYINGWDGRDTLHGGIGVDSIEGHADPDWIFGGSDGDLLDGGDQNDTIYGEDGPNTIYGGHDNDVLYATSPSTNSNFTNVIHGDHGDDVIIASNGNDSLYGDDGNDSIQGRDGNDFINGLAHDDTILAGDGNDIVFGDAGNDSIFGENGDDKIYPGEGDDFVNGGSSTDNCTFIDTVSFELSATKVNIDNAAGVAHGEGFDHISEFECLIASEFDDTIRSKASIYNLIIGLGGNDIYLASSASVLELRDSSGADTIIQDSLSIVDALLGPGDDYVFADFRASRNSFCALSSTSDFDGESGIDSISYVLTPSTDSLTIVVSDSLLTVGRNSAFDSVANFDWFEGHNGVDSVYFAFDSVNGTAPPMYLLDGADTVYCDSLIVNAVGTFVSTGSGNDVIAACSASTVLADAGNDSIQVGFGSNHFLIGSDGIDTIHYTQPVFMTLCDDIPVNDTIVHTTTYGLAYFVGSPADQIDTLAEFEWIIVSTGDDTVYACDIAETIVSSGGEDYIDAGEGDDSVYSTGLFSHLFGGSDDDTLVFRSSTVYGGDGNDSLFHTPGTAASLAGSLVFGEEGNDSIFADSIAVVSDSLYGNDDSDFIHGYNGADFIDGGVGNDSLYGDADDDIIHGDDGNDLIFGATGRDSIYGGEGNDSISGGDQDDHLNGGVGDDSVYGGSGQDLIIGDAGNDLLSGGNEIDHIYGGDNDDLLLGGDGADFLYGEDGNDLLRGNNGPDWLEGGQLFDSLYGGPACDTLLGGLGNDYIDGEDGACDVVIYDYPFELVLGQPYGFVLSHDGRDTLINVEYVLGSVWDDTISGNAVNNSILGNNGNDSIDHGTGIDTIEGQNGNDTIYGIFDCPDFLAYPRGIIDGGNDRDYIIAVTSHNYNGGADEDTIDYSRILPCSPNGGALYADLWWDTVNPNFYYGLGVLSPKARLENFEYIIATSQSDSILGSPLAETILGGAGTDTLFGGDNVDYLDGQEGSNVYSRASLHNRTSLIGSFVSMVDNIACDVNPSSFIHTIDDHLPISSTTAGCNNADSIFNFDSLFGSPFRDTIFGNPALPTTLFGDYGNDSLVGGNQADFFPWWYGDGYDVIEGNEGADSIYIRNSPDSSRPVDSHYSAPQFFTAANPLEAFYFIGDGLDDPRFRVVFQTDYTVPTSIPLNQIPDDDAFSHPSKFQGISSHIPSELVNDLLVTPRNRYFIIDNQESTSFLDLTSFPFNYHSVRSVDNSLNPKYVNFGAPSDGVYLIGTSHDSNYDTFNINLPDTGITPYIYVDGGRDYPYPLNTLQLVSTVVLNPVVTLITPETRWDGIISLNYDGDRRRASDITTIRYENIAPIEYLVAGTTDLTFDFTHLFPGAEAESDMTLYLAYPDSSHMLIRSSTGKDYSFSSAGLTSLKIYTPGCVTLIGTHPAYLTIEQSDCCCVRRIPVPYCFAEQKNPLC